MFKTGFEYKITIWICALVVLWSHKGYYVVKKWSDIFVLKLSGIQNVLYDFFRLFLASICWIIHKFICLVFGGLIHPLLSHTKTLKMVLTALYMKTLSKGKNEYFICCRIVHNCLHNTLLFIIIIHYFIIFVQQKHNESIILYIMLFYSCYYHTALTIIF